MSHSGTLQQLHNAIDFKFGIVVRCWDKKIHNITVFFANGAEMGGSKFQSTSSSWIVKYVVFSISPYIYS